MGKKKFRLPLETGLAALLSHIREIRRTAEDAGSAVSTLASETGQSLREIEAFLNDKQDGNLSGSLTIPVSGWNSDSMMTYPNYRDISVEGVTEADHAAVSVTPASAAAALTCGLCPACQTLTGVIRIRALSVPTTAISAEYLIHRE